MKPKSTRVRVLGGVLLAALAGSGTGVGPKLIHQAAR